MKVFFRTSTFSPFSRISPPSVCYGLSDEMDKGDPLNTSTVDKHGTDGKTNPRFWQGLKRLLMNGRVKKMNTTITKIKPPPPPKAMATFCAFWRVYYVSVNNTRFELSLDKHTRSADSKSVAVRSRIRSDACGLFEWSLGACGGQMHNGMLGILSWFTSKKPSHRIEVTSVAVKNIV